MPGWEAGGCGHVGASLHASGFIPSHAFHVPPTSPALRLLKLFCLARMCPWTAIIHLACLCGEQRELLGCIQKPLCLELQECSLFNTGQSHACYFTLFGRSLFPLPHPPLAYDPWMVSPKRMGAKGWKRFWAPGLTGFVNKEIDFSMAMSEYGKWMTSIMPRIWKYPANGHSLWIPHTRNQAIKKKDYVGFYQN